MLELIDLGKRLSKETCDQVFPEMERQLGECQRAARAAGVPVVIVLEGWDAAGKGTIINRLTQVLDPRGFKVHPISAPTEVERLHPWMWRFWNDLPAAGQFAIFDQSWYCRVLTERIESDLSRRQWEEASDEIQQFERQLVDAGAVIVKFWLHISKKEQERRFQKLEANPATAWKIGKPERRQHRKYKRWLEAAEDMLQRTSTAQSPWTIVEATQGRYRQVKVFETVIKAVQSELAHRVATPRSTPQPMAVPPDSPTQQQTILDRLDLTLSLEREEYDTELKQLQKRLFDLEHELYMARVPAVIVYEGSDAGGKGGNIKRLTRGLDPRGYEVVPVAAPDATRKSPPLSLAILA